jgi:hypothetical protein
LPFLAEDKLASSAEFSFGHTEFDDFLFSSIGKEENGIELSVLSALTRLGFDPWAEAARLSDLPGDTAERSLLEVIALLPEGDWKRSSAIAIATRLVDQLPRRRLGAVQSSQKRCAEAQKSKSDAAIWLVVIALVAAAVIGIWG